MRKITLVLLTFLSFIGCKDNVEELALRYIESARTAFESEKYSEAKQYIDSIKILYPNAFETRKQGIKLMLQVEEAEQLRTIAYETEMIAACNDRIEPLKKNFKFEKDEKYQDLGLYVLASQVPEKNVGVNYLRGQVDELGRLVLISTYSASSYLHHRSVRVVCGDVYAESPVSDDYYEFKDLGICYEKCNMKAGEDGGVAAFIAMNRDKNIKVQLNGADGKKREYTMRPSDRTAIASLYDLSVLMTELEDHKKIKEEAERRLQFTRSRINGSETVSE
ncbi:MAG: hypothetical protein J6V02_08210 [Bacteroidaceae bacterium]|nr:hypothetical protein [Bacteroidaceae bacterium]